MMRRIIFVLLTGFFAALLMAVSGHRPSFTGIGPCVDKFKEDSKAFSGSTLRLRSAIAAIDASDSQTVSNARKALEECRMQYKTLEFFFEYFFPTAAVTYNMPPNYEVEEPNIEYIEPVGLQVIESLLYEKNVAARKKELLLQMEVITSSAEDINSLLFNFKGDDKQLLESIRLELIRVMTLGVSGFDAPLLKSGIRESYAALGAVKTALEPFLEQGGRGADSVSFYLQGALDFLRENPDFDSFDRLGFFTGYAMPLQRHLGIWIRQSGMEMNSAPALNYNAANLFSPDLFVKNAFSSSAASGNDLVIALGETLFFENALSGNGKKSCASCHDPKLYYTDGLKKSRAFDDHSFVERNAPSVLYAAFQYSQRWDGSAISLEDQVLKVLHSPVEMNAKSEVIIQRLQNKDAYRRLFDRAFGSTGDRSVSLDNLAYAIAEFIRNCNSFSSRFDRYMQGDQAALTQKEKKGFNIFMGKAQCGTCHFAPLFNGLTPPLYNLSEVEIIGVPRTEQLNKPEYDGDRGRYNVYQTRFYDKAFKTPGLRNVEKTAPYMHNGAFTTLKHVMDFYNRGGSNGIGLPQSNQTLSPDSLRLTDREIDEVISFMNTLTDTLPSPHTTIKY